MQLFFSHCAVFNCTLSEVSDYVHEDCNFFFFFFFLGGGGESCMATGKLHGEQSYDFACIMKMIGFYKE